MLVNTVLRRLEPHYALSRFILYFLQKSDFYSYILVI